MDYIYLVPLLPGIPFGLANGRHQQESKRKEETEVSVITLSSSYQARVGRGCLPLLETTAPLYSCTFQ